jgi:hypothetical protein
MEHALAGLTTGRLSGIIDWCGGFGDPVRDLSYVLLHGGWSLFQRLMDAYDLPLDAEFAERTLFSARLGALGWLADTVKRGASTSRHVAIVRRVFELEWRCVGVAPAEISIGFGVLRSWPCSVTPTLGALRRRLGPWRLHEHALAS